MDKQLLFDMIVTGANVIIPLVIVIMIILILCIIYKNKRK